MSTKGFINGEWQDGEVRGRVFVAGCAGFGKTTEMWRMLSTCRGRVIFFDPLADHHFANFFTVRQPGQLIDALRVGKKKLIYQPDQGDMSAHFRTVCEAVKILRDVVLGVDEIDMFCGPHWGDSRMPPELYHLVHYGRHCRVALVFTSREPMRVARGATASCTEMRLFNMHETNHVGYFGEFIGQSRAAILKTLPQYEYMRWKKNEAAVSFFNGARELRKNTAGKNTF